MINLFRTSLLLSFLLLGFNAQAQKDTTEANRLHQLGWSFRNSNPDSLLYYGEKELQLAQTINYDLGIANANTLIAIFYQYETNYPKSLDYYNHALTVFEEINSEPQIASALTNIGNIYFRQSEYTKALQFFNQALDIRIEQNDSLGIACNNAQLGLVHTELGNYDKGLEFLYSALNVYQRNSDKIGIAQSHNNLAINYFEQENLEEALVHYNVSLILFEELQNYRGIAEVTNNIGEVYLKKGNTKMAMERFQKSIELFENIGHKKGIVIIFKNMAWVNYYDGELFKARRNCLHALRENISMGDQEGEAEVLLLMGSIELKDQKPESAIDYLTEAFFIAQKINSKKFIKDGSEALYKTYTELKDYKNANRYLLYYSSIKDSLVSIEKIRAIARQNANYTLAKRKSDLDHKTQEIELLQQAQSLQKQKSIALSSLAILIILLGVIVWFRMRYTLRKEQEIVLKDKQIAESQKALIEAELKNTQFAKEELKNRLDFKNNEIQNFALHIVEKNEFISEISSQIELLKNELKDPIIKEKVRDLSSKVKYSLSVDRERQKFQKHIKQLNSEFFLRLEQLFPSITESEKKLTALLRLNLTSKEIASILNISAKSVDMNRYRLRKKFEITKDSSLTNFISKI
ncbi:MAG: tetratricopeptide repeat protein [Flavobacteriales bacterium]|nr:tetratricopeptide repeat protein [Flavobacteriales bacterium]